MEKRRLVGVARTLGPRWFDFWVDVLRTGGFAVAGLTALFSGEGSFVGFLVGFALLAFASYLVYVSSWLRKPVADVALVEDERRR